MEELDKLRALAEDLGMEEFFKACETSAFDFRKAGDALYACAEAVGDLINKHYTIGAEGIALNLRLTTRPTMMLLMGMYVGCLSGEEEMRLSIPSRPTAWEFQEAVRAFFLQVSKEAVEEIKNKNEEEANG